MAEFYEDFQRCMGAQGLPVPQSLFGTVSAALATVSAIYKGVKTYGSSVTIAELVGAGVLADALVVAGSLLASYYAGAMVGCLISAGVSRAEIEEAGASDLA